MGGWIILAILLIIIASVVIWSRKYEKRSGEKIGWDFLLMLVIGLGILGGVVWCFRKVDEFSPLEAGFWLYLVIGGLLVLAAIKYVLTLDDYEKLKKRREEFWEIQVEYRKLKEQEEEKEILEEESRKRKYRRKKQDNQA